MKRIVLLLVSLCVITAVSAQPSKRRVTTTTNTATTPSSQTKDATTEAAATDRVAMQFPTTDETPEDVVWRRDIYRTLDLLNDKNAPLYYPIEPSGKNQNLFTYLFRLMLSGRINAYTYKLDGNESFAAEDKADVRELLNRYSIYYEEKNGKITVPASDIPSAEVTRYYIKESNYFDQRSATYKTKVTALCPVLMRGADEFGTEATPYPLFWINYDDVSGYLSRLPMMASNLNNVTNMTAADYFTLNRYEGKIYKTNNLQGKVLANYCKTDSAMSKEQKRIEEELEAFERSIWSHETKTDSVANDSVQAKDQKKEKKEKKSSSSSRRSSSSEAAASTKRSSSSSSSSSSAPAASARRQRR